MFKKNILAKISEPYLTTTTIEAYKYRNNVTLIKALNVNVTIM